MLTAQCNCYRIMTPFRLFPYDPCFHFANLFTTGARLPGKIVFIMCFRQISLLMFSSEVASPSIPTPAVVTYLFVLHSDSYIPLKDPCCSSV